MRPGGCAGKDSAANRRPGNPRYRMDVSEKPYAEARLLATGSKIIRNGTKIVLLCDDAVLQSLRRALRTSESN
jgi:hypothetical protein